MKEVYKDEEETESNVQYLSSHGNKADEWEDTKHDDIKNVENCSDVKEIHKLELGGSDNKWKYYLTQHEDGDITYDSIYREKK